jgi:hypothetical protein
MQRLPPCAIIYLLERNGYVELMGCGDVRRKAKPTRSPDASLSVEAREARVLRAFGDDLVAVVDETSPADLTLWLRTLAKFGEGGERR